MFAPAVLRPFLVIASLLALLLLSGPPLGVKADGQPSPDDGTAAGPACGDEGDHFRSVRRMGQYPGVDDRRVGRAVGPHGDDNAQAMVELDQVGER